MQRPAHAGPALRAMGSVVDARGNAMRALQLAEQAHAGQDVTVALQDALDYLASAYDALRDAVGLYPLTE